MNRNLSIGTSISPTSTTDNSITLRSGDIQNFPDTPFFATICPAVELATPYNSEILLVTQIVGDTMVIRRAQKRTNAKSFPGGSIIFVGHYYEGSARVGDIFMTLKTNPTPGRMFMDGTAFEEEEYPLLASFIDKNPKYGSRIASGVYKLTDMRGRFPLMTRSGISVGVKGGSENYALTPNNYRQNAWQSQALGGGSLKQGFNNLGENRGSGMNTFAGGALTSPGNNEPFSIMPPYISVNFEVVTG